MDAPVTITTGFLVIVVDEMVVVSRRRIIARLSECLVGKSEMYI